MARTMTIRTPPILAAIAAIAPVERPDWVATIVLDVAEAGVISGDVEIDYI